MLHQLHMFLYTRQAAADTCALLTGIATAASFEAPQASDASSPLSDSAKYPDLTRSGEEGSAVNETGHLPARLT